MDSKKHDDLETLNEIFDGVGFSNSLVDGSAKYYSFNDKEIEEAYKQIDKAVKLIRKKYDELKEE